MATKLKIKLHHKLEPKHHLAVWIYDTDKERFEKAAADLGLTSSNLMRTLINNLLDGTIEVVL